MVKHLAYDVGDLGSIPGSGRYSGEGNGNPLPCSCLENPMDGGACWAVVYGVQRVAFRMDWLDLLTVQGTLKSLLQHHSSKALILRHSAFFTVQVLHPYMTTGSGPITSWQIDGETVALFLGAPKSLQMVIAAMKLKDACSLEEKL